MSFPATCKNLPSTSTPQPPPTASDLLGTNGQTLTICYWSNSLSISALIDSAKLALGKYFFLVCFRPLIVLPKLTVSICDSPIAVPEASGMFRVEFRWANIPLSCCSNQETFCCGNLPKMKGKESFSEEGGGGVWNRKSNELLD